jgi:UDP-N-acetylglucosamine enolpyruvyl transferase
MSQYVNILERFGGRAELREGCIEVVSDGFRGCTIDLLDFCDDPALRTGPRYSGASKYAVLCAVAARGITRLLNLYPKTDVTGLVNILRRMGADIERGSADELVVTGRGIEALDRPVDFELPTDLIELVTWISVAAIEDTRILIQGHDLDGAFQALAPELEILDRMGVWPSASAEGVTVATRSRLRSVDITATSLGVFSDSQPFLTLLATHASGTSRVRDLVWQRRFGYARGLAQLGADLHTDHHTLVIDGPCPPRRPSRVSAGDLRAAAVLLIAAVRVAGLTRLQGASHLRRGYADLPDTLNALGADITYIRTMDGKLP